MVKKVFCFLFILICPFTLLRCTQAGGGDGDNNPRFVAVGDKGRTWWSPDGVNWTESSPDPGGPDFWGVTYGAGRFVAVGQDGRIWHSPDGTLGSWTNVSVGGIERLRDICYGNSRFVAVGVNGKAWWSPDASLGTWTDASPGGGDINTVAYLNGRFMTSGASTACEWSVDGTLGSWTNFSIRAGFYNNYGIAYGNGRYVIMGTGDNKGQSYVKTDFTPGGWGEYATSFNADFYDGIFVNGLFVAAGGGLTGQIYWSADGANWTEILLGGGTSLRAIAYGNDRFVVGGSAGQTWWSPDGLNWFGPATLGDYVNAIAYADLSQ